MHRPTLKTWLALTAALCAVLALPARAQSVAGKKVLFVNSYHEGYPWSDGEEQGAKTALKGSGVELRFFRMDTKRHQDEPYRKQAGERAKAEIEAFKPDLVIVSDDPAVKYLLQAYFKNGKIPFVFCGVNWDASKYGLPYANATGIVEIAPVKQLVANLRAMAKGGRIGYLTVDSETERIEGPAYTKTLGAPFATELYAKTFAQWKEGFVRMQSQADFVLLGNMAGINDWNEAEGKAFVLANAKVPVGAAYDFMMPYAMLGLTKIEEEQGAWAGQTALAILRGAAPASIPIAANSQSKIFMNVKLAQAAKLVFRPEIVRTAQVVQ
jgi:ABC-type uncharacterized transport system substrate-binding protein